jgi:hypothetical protein
MSLSAHLACDTDGTVAVTGVPESSGVPLVFHLATEEEMRDALRGVDAGAQPFTWSLFALTASVKCYITYYIELPCTYSTHSHLL